MITFIKSFIIGICAILPGVSGSVIAVSFGIYNRFVEIVTETRKIKTNKLFLFLVITGTLSGIFLTSNLLVYIFRYKIIIYYLLIGIILSEVPFLVMKIHSYNGNKVQFLPLVLAFLFSLILDLLNGENKEVSYSVFKYFIGGILFAFGKIFPGVSSSFFLLCLGIYEDIIILVTNPLLFFKNFYFYIPFIIGTIFGLLIFLKLLSYLLKSKYEFIYSVILGFILSSTIILLPKFVLDLYNIIGILLMVTSFLIFFHIKIKNEHKLLTKQMKI